MDDADSRSAETAVPHGGRFILFAQVVPKGGTEQVVRTALQAAGETPATPVAVDPADSDGRIEKYFTADGREGVNGDAYRINLQPEFMDMPGMRMLTLRAEVQQRGCAGGYEPVTDIQPWLGMPAHAVLIAADGTEAQSRVFRHLHAHEHSNRAPVVLSGEGGGAGPALTFMLEGSETPPPGLYRTWLQFKHHERVLALPFTFGLSAEG